jgi:hypothetical protein
VKSAERLLQCEYYELTDPNGRTILRTPNITLDDEVWRHVDLLGPTIRIQTLAEAPQSQRESEARASDATYSTPPSLRSMYGASDLLVSPSTNSSAPNCIRLSVRPFRRSQPFERGRRPPRRRRNRWRSGFAVAGFLDQYFDPADVEYFFKSFDKASSGRKIKVALAGCGPPCSRYARRSSSDRPEGDVQVHGPNSPTSSGEEATLDVCYGAAMANGGCGVP